MLRHAIFLMAAMADVPQLPPTPTNAPVPSEVARLVLEREIDEAGPSVVLCLVVGTSDPSPTLLAKLRRKDRTIVPGSECRPATGSVKPSYHAKTGKPAHFLSVYNPVQLSPTSLRVQAENYYHGKWAIFWTVELALLNGKWQITKFQEIGEA
jgi:hypothetical protein